MKRRTRRRKACSTLGTAMAVLTLAGAGWAGAKTESAPIDLKPRDLTPVTWLEAPAHPPVDIVRDRQARAVVYVVDPKGRESADPKKSGGRPTEIKQLVDQLIATIETHTGVRLDVVGQPPAADQSAIVIGDCEETRGAGIDAAALPAEGFVVKTAANRVYLVGSTSGGDGTPWAVADFLERFTGARWYWPIPYGGQSIPHSDSLIIPPVHYRDAPVTPYRRMYQDWYWLQARSSDEEILPMAPGAGAAGSDTLWLGDHFRLMRQGNSWPYQAVQQGARIYEFMRNVPKTNTLMFAQREDGSRNLEVFCYGSPELLACYVDNLERAWSKDGKGVFLGGITRSSVTLWPPLDLGNNSLLSACHCTNCLPLLAKGGDELLMGDFIRRLSAEVKTRWPDKTVIYVPWSIPNCPPGVEFSGNVVVSSLDLGTMGLLHQPSLRKEQEGLLRSWSALTGRPITMWTDFAGPGDWTFGPVQFPHMVKDFYEQNRKQLDGGMILSYGAACFVTAAPTYYIWNRVLWNPAVDVDATLDELCKRLFGAGAASARELLRLQCDRWEKTALSRPLRIAEQRVPPKLFREIWPPDVVARMKDLRDQALDDIERSGAADARKAFLYWTWSFDAFLDYAGTINATATPASAGENAAAHAPADGDNIDAAARFHGGTAETKQVRIANVRRLDRAADEAGGQSDVRFDLSAGNMWRATWTEPAADNVTGKDLALESWSAVWVFAKYRMAGQETQSYARATLAPRAVDHTVPAGAALEVGLTDGKGVGVFIYRSGVGHGPLDLKDVNLRWLHGADGVSDPAAVDLKVFALEMVYVPRGPFQAGSRGTESGTFTDGAWADGAPPIPFRVDAEWSGPVAEGSNARRIGAAPGRLWGVSEQGRDTIGPEGALVQKYPTGFEPFYCMRHEVTRGQFTDFLNTLSREAFASTSGGDSTHAGGTFTAAGRYALSGTWPNFKAAKPYQACNLLSWWDGAKFAAWAGLRPMTELEYEKACRGPRLAVAEEFAWGTAGIAQTEYTATREGQFDERLEGTEGAGVGNANYDLTMPAYFGGRTRGGVSAIPGSPTRAGVFATPLSDRLAAGASYWGILDLSGNVRELVVTVGHARGRSFAGSQGAGSLDIPADWPPISGADLALGTGYRGGFFGDLRFPLRTSDRSRAVFKHREASFSREARSEANGWRGVRTAPGVATEAGAEMSGGAGTEGAVASPVAVQTERKMPRIGTTVRADGALDEWGGKRADTREPAQDRPPLVRRTLSRIWPEDRRHPPGRRVLWQGPDDFSVKAWWGWDGEALCVAAEVRDDVHVNKQSGAMIWNGDAMQVGIAISTNVHWNLGLALTTNGVVFHQFEGKGDTLSQTATRAVVRDAAAGITRYELRLPLADLGLQAGVPFGFNLVFLDDDDGSGSQYWFQLAPGLCGRTAKSPPQFETYPRFILAD